MRRAKAPAFTGLVSTFAAPILALAAAELLLRSLRARPALRRGSVPAERRVDVAGTLSTTRAGRVEVLALRSALALALRRIELSLVLLLNSAALLHRWDEVTASDAITAVKSAGALRAGWPGILRPDVATGTFGGWTLTPRWIEIALELRLALRTFAALPFAALKLRPALRASTIIQRAAGTRRLALAARSPRIVAARTGLRATVALLATLRPLHARHRRRANALERLLDMLELLGRELRAKFVEQRHVEVPRRSRSAFARFARLLALGLGLSLAGWCGIGAAALLRCGLRAGLPVLRVEGCGGERGAERGGGRECGECFHGLVEWFIFTDLVRM